MNNTKIEWCDSTWNPVTGCLHGCAYCYARRIANRFAGHWYTLKQRGFNAYKKCDDNGKHIIADLDERYIYMPEEDGHNRIRIAQKSPCFELDYPLQYVYKGESAGTTNNKANYPFNFLPTFHRYRLEEPARKKNSQNIFVCSMADLFGEWVPDDWIEEVFKACEVAPQHRYLFLTKNPNRYREALPLWQAYHGRLKNIWLGASVSNNEMPMYFNTLQNTFVSIEPILEKIDIDAIGNGNLNWVIIGAETGKRKNKVIPKREWIESIVEQCRAARVPVFMKNSLIPIVGEENMRRDFPWEV